jgi:hypothetical protein
MFNIDDDDLGSLEAQDLTGVDVRDLGVTVEISLAVLEVFLATLIEARRLIQFSHELLEIRHREIPEKDKSDRELVGSVARDFSEFLRALDNVIVLFEKAYRAAEKLAASGTNRRLLVTLSSELVHLKNRSKYLN